MGKDEASDYGQPTGTSFALTTQAVRSAARLASERGSCLGAMPLAWGIVQRPCRTTEGDSFYYSRQAARSEEHTSELQSQSNLVCRLLLEKKKKKHKNENVLQTEKSIK